MSPGLREIISRTGTDQNTVGYRFIQRFFTLILVSIAWILFRAPGLSAGVHMIRLIFTDFRFTGLINNIYSFGISETYTWFLLFAVTVMFSVENIHKRIHIRDHLDRQPLPVRWFVYITGILIVVLMGNYGLDGTSMFQYAFFWYFCLGEDHEKNNNGIFSQPLLFTCSYYHQRL